MTVRKLKKNRVTKRKRTQRGDTRRLVRAGLTALWCLLPCAGAALLWYGLLHAGFLQIAGIQVSGCSRLDPAAVIRSSGIEQGSNILAVSPSAATERLERNPWIYTAVVKRTLPGSIAIMLQEREARARIQLEDVYLVDSHGEIFLPAGPEESQLPLLTGLTTGDIGSPDAAASRLMQAAMQLIQCLQGRQLQGLSIAMDRVFGLTMHEAATGTSVFLGFDGFEEKLAILRMVQNDLSQKGLTAATIHVNSTKQAYVTVQQPVQGHPAAQHKTADKVT
jgi:cell division protein FtsQ